MAFILSWGSVLSTIFNSNVELLQCYGIFLTSLKITFNKVKNTRQPCDTQQHHRTLQETLHSPSARWGRDSGITSPYAEIQDCSMFSTPTQMKYHSLFGTTFHWKSHHVGTSPSICFTNQFTGSYMTQVPTGSHLRTYFCMEIIKTSHRYTNFRKPLFILIIPKSKINLALKMTMTPKSFRKLTSGIPFENTL